MANSNDPNPPAGGDNPPQPPQPPQGITPEQLHAAIEKARLEEREKVRKQLEQTEDSSKAAKAEADSLKTKLTQLSDELSSIKAGMKPEGGVDVTKAIEQAVSAASARLSSVYSDEIAGLKNELAVERSERNRLSLEQVKAKLIQEAGGATALIPELVQGSNVDELRTSIEASKQVFQRILTSGATIPSSQQRQHGNSGESGTVPVVPSVPIAGANSPGSNAPRVSVRAMGREEFAEKRAQLKREAAARYPAAVLTQ